MNQFQRKSIQFRPSEWGKLREIAMIQGFRSRHALIRNAIVQILAENVETPDTAPLLYQGFLLNMDTIEPTTKMGKQQQNRGRTIRIGNEDWECLETIAKQRGLTPQGLS